MLHPTAADVAAFLGQGDDTSVVALAGEHLPLVAAMAQAYTRGQGFTDGEPAEDVAAVLVVACARMMSNPDQTDTRIGEVSVKGGWQGWTLPELAVLNRYRRTSA